MTRAGRIMGAMMAMTAGLGDYGGGSPNRERYDQWCKRRGFGWSSVTRIERAEAKRARKAAKRRRDAERTEAGRQAAATVAQQAGNYSAFSFALSYASNARQPWAEFADYLMSVRRRRRNFAAWYMRALRRGEVVPAESPVWFEVAS